MEQSKLGILQAAKEDSYGVLGEATLANIGVVRSSVSLQYESEDVARALSDSTFSRAPGWNALPRIGLKFRTELRGNRTTGLNISTGKIANAVEIDPLLLACDLEAMYSAESGLGAQDGMVIYLPTVPSTDGNSCRFEFTTQKKKYVISGAKGNIEQIVFESGKPAYIDWQFWGLFNAPEDSAGFPEVTWLSTAPPLWQNTGVYVNHAVTVTEATNTVNLNDNTLRNGDLVKFGGEVIPAGLSADTWYYVIARAANSFQLSETLNGLPFNFGAGTNVTITSQPALLVDSWNTAVCSAASFKLGNAMEMRPDCNSTNGVRGYVITGRNMTGEISPESESEATHAAWAKWAAASTGKLRFKVGNDVGNIIQLEMTTEPKNVSYEDANGRRIQKASFAVVRPLGQGWDFRLIFK